MCEYNSSEYNPAIEFNTLRDEISQGKKYVFERPLLVFTLSIGATNFIEINIVSYLFAIVLSFAIFNLWITVDRLKSAARIVAYIQVVLEAKMCKPWLGWETSLRKYRVWMKNRKDDNRKLVNEVNEDKNKPVSMGYYLAIYIMHWVMSIFLIVGCFRAYVNSCGETENILLISVSVIVFVIFSYFSYLWRPSEIVKLIEENRRRWILVLNCDDNRD